MSVLSIITKTLSPWLLELVSIYIKALPTVGKVSAAELDVGEFVSVYRKKFVTYPLLFLSLQTILHPGNK